MIGRARCFSIGLWLFLWLLGCGSPGTTAVTTPPPASLPQSTRSLPTPAVGRGVVHGRVWERNGVAASGYTVLLCETFGQDGRCDGRQYTVETDADGDYVFTEVEPGYYALAVQADKGDKGYWQYASDRVQDVKLFEVERHQPLLIDPITLFAYDTPTLQPRRQINLVSNDMENDVRGVVTLRWEDVPGAVAYEVYLAPERGDTIFARERVDRAVLMATLPRINCDYVWGVTAFNADNMQIAESGEGRFFVAGETADCTITLLSPKLDGTISTTVKPIIFDWTAVETADHYQIWLQDAAHSQRPPVINFATVYRSRYELPNGLVASRYAWTVIAYDEKNHIIAEAAIAQFEVVP